MLTFSYTISLQLRTLLSRADQLRTNILTLPIAPKTEIKLAWETVAIRIWATFALAQEEVPKHQIATILANHTRPSRQVQKIFSHAAAYRFIHNEWRANPNPITIKTLETLFYLLYGQTERANQTFMLVEQSLRELLAYITAADEHPIIQSAIVHIHLLTLPALSDDHGLFARLASYIFLAKYGYDIRGFIAPERSLYDASPTYNHLTSQYIAKPNLTIWLSFVAESYISALERLLNDLTTNRFYIQFPRSFWEMSDRQKEILKLLENPETEITNKKVQKQFHVSQITASRDLTKLVTLGILYPHGKGRSIYYTKI